MRLRTNLRAALVVMMRERGIASDRPGMVPDWSWHRLVKPVRISPSASDGASAGGDLSVQSLLP